MYRCDYCKRYLKKKYDNCPGCGGDKFTKTPSMDYQVINEPPEGGYKINIENYKLQKMPYTLPKWLMIIFLILEVAFASIFVFVGYDLLKEETFGGAIFIIFGLFFIIALVCSTVKFIKPFKEIFSEKIFDLKS